MAAAGLSACLGPSVSSRQPEVKTIWVGWGKPSQELFSLSLECQGERALWKIRFPCKNEKMWFFLSHLVFCNVGYSCLGHSCRWQNVFPAVPSESSLWFEGTATAPCGETHGHPAQGTTARPSVLPIPTFPKQGVATGIPGKVPSWGVMVCWAQGGYQWCQWGTAVTLESLFPVLSCPHPVGWH